MNTRQAWKKKKGKKRKRIANSGSSIDLNSRLNRKTERRAADGQRDRRSLEDKKIMAEKNNNIVSVAYGSDMDDDGREVNKMTMV